MDYNLQFEQYKEMVGIAKNQLQQGDMLFFKNGVRTYFDKSIFWIIVQYYDSDLNCLTDDQYTITKVYRPDYKLIYDKNKVKEKKK